MESVQASKSALEPRSGERSCPMAQAMGKAGTITTQLCKGKKQISDRLDRYGIYDGGFSVGRSPCAPRWSNLYLVILR